MCVFLRYLWTTVFALHFFHLYLIIYYFYTIKSEYAILYLYTGIFRYIFMQAICFRSVKVKVQIKCNSRICIAFILLSSSSLLSQLKISYSCVVIRINFSHHILKDYVNFKLTITKLNTFVSIYFLKRVFLFRRYLHIKAVPVALPVVSLLFSMSTYDLFMCKSTSLLFVFTMSLKCLASQRMCVMVCVFFFGDILTQINM